MRVRARLWLVILGTMATVTAARTARAADPISWLQLSPGCTVRPSEIGTTGGEEPQIVACGGAGTFLFGPSGLTYGGACPVLEGGSESSTPIPVEPAPRLSPAFPCPSGSCLGRSPGRPWVAVLDWPTAHGWSVAATIREAADDRVDVKLYDLTAAGTIAQWVPPVSDLHVLVQLCAVAEAARAKPGERPLAVNMSFGRRTVGADSASEHSLGGSISRVLSYLATKEGIFTVAAAGNHHELLFPASSPGVLSAGALDLAYLEQNGAPRPSAQTSSASRALMPGYGLYLASRAKDGSAAEAPAGYWPAPPGSSYAAAVLTGWLSGTLAASDANPLLAGELAGQSASHLAGGRWTPMTTANGLALAVDGVPLPGSELTGPRRLLERAIGGVPVAGENVVSYAALRLDGPAPPLPELSLLYAEDGNGPQPGVNPCVPCHGGWGEGMESSGAVFVDFSSSEGLPPQAELVAVFLSVGDKVYSFAGSRDPDLLATVAAGSLAGLTLDEVGGIFRPGEQASLVLVINVGGLAYWHEVPLNLPGRPGEG
jgi:hypothetical protein